MPIHRFTYKQFLLFLSSILMFECVLSILYYDDSIALKPNQNVQDSYVSEVKDIKDKFQQFRNFFSSNVSRSNDSERIDVNSTQEPLITSKNCKEGELLVILSSYTKKAGCKCLPAGPCLSACNKLQTSVKTKSLTL